MIFRRSGMDVVAALAIGMAWLFPASRAMAQVELVRRYDAPEARQGVAADREAIYAVGDSEIGRYDKATGKRTAVWTGDPQRFPHLNSCAAIGEELVCAASNYPATPMDSRIEVFDRRKLSHLRSIPLGRQDGSLTWAVRRKGVWWACFANYDGKGGEPGRDHRATVLATFDDRWRRLRTWRFPDGVLARLAPRSASGGVWAPDGMLYVTGHDAAEIYVLRLPRRGEVLEHVATLPAPIEGQAIAIDPTDPSQLYGISRSQRQIVAMRAPPAR